MSTETTDDFLSLTPEDIIPGDPVATICRWCVKNNWTFIYDMLGGEPFIDPRCAAAYCLPGTTYKSAQNSLLNGVHRYPGGTVRLSEVMHKRTDAPEPKPEIAPKSRPKKRPAS